MEKEFIPYEQALALKELGFEEPCFMFYWSKHKGKLIKTSLMNHISKVKNNSDLIFDSNNTALGLKDGIFCSAPLYQQVARYLYIKSNNKINIELNGSDDTEELNRKIKQGIQDLRNLQNNKSN